MYFGVLGPLFLRLEEHAALLRGRKQVVLLGVLLSQANSAVSAGRLVEALWGTGPPASAGTTLRWHVHQLRRALDDEARIVRLRSGYGLTVHPGELDADRFEQLVNEGRDRLDEPDAERASALLQQALSLWRGPAYAELADLDLPAVHDEAARLGELRLVAQHHQIEADQLLGRDRALVPKLRTLVAEHPLREGFRAQLMLALYRSGQQAEALEVYRHGRRVLAEELGIDPGPELQRLEREILSGAVDPQPHVNGRSRARTRAATAGQKRPVERPPAELPLDPPGFTGRETDIRKLLPHFENSCTAVVISGPGGIGKSALAVHLGQLLAPRFPDGQLYVNLCGSTPGLAPLHPGEVLNRFVRSLGVRAGSGDPSSVDELAATFRSATAGKRVLLVLDDAASTAQIWPLLPGSPSCAVIVTSRRALSGGLRHHRLAPLPEAEASDLLRHLIGDDRAADSGALADVAGLCDRMPLALCVSGARLAARPAWPLRQFAERLRDERNRLDELSDGDRAVRAGFAVSYEDLLRQAPGGRGADAARVFRLAGLLDVPDLGVSTAAALADLPPRMADGLLDLLVTAQLMENDVPGRYRLHDLLRLFARERAAVEEPEQERAAALIRALHHCVDTARAASTTVRPTSALWIRTGSAAAYGHQPRRFSSVQETNHWVEAELENFLPLAAQAARLPGDGPELAVGLAAALVVPLGACGLGVRQRALSDIASGAAQRTGVPGHLAIASYMRGLVLHSVDPDEAARQLCAARRLWAESGNKYAEALALQHLGTTAGSLGQYARSLECLTEALQVFRRFGSLDGEASTLDHLGLAYRRLGRQDESIASYRSGLALARKLGDRVLEAIGATNLATTLHFFGDMEAAIPAYEEALQLSRSYGNRLAEAECLWGLAEASGERGAAGRRRELLGDSTDLLCALGIIGRDLQQEILTATKPAPPPGFWTNI